MGTRKVIRPNVKVRTPKQILLRILDTASVISSIENRRIVQRQLSTRKNERAWLFMGRIRFPGQAGLTSAFTRHSSKPREAQSGKVPQTVAPSPYVLQRHRGRHAERIARQYRKDRQGAEGHAPKVVWARVSRTQPPSVVDYISHIKNNLRSRSAVAAGNHCQLAPTKERLRLQIDLISAVLCILYEVCKLRGLSFERESVEPVFCFLLHFGFLQRFV